MTTPVLTLTPTLSLALQAHLHPALALIPIVPFMPGPNRELLEHLEEEVEDEVLEVISFPTTQLLLIHNDFFKILCD